MNSEQHAAEAAKWAERGMNGDHYDEEMRARTLMFAQVHAQLATAAAIRETRRPEIVVAGPES